MNPILLEGKTILVTGASSGIGKQTAVCLSQLGAVLMLQGRDTQRLQNTLSLLDGEGHRVFSGDLTHDNTIQHICDAMPALDGIAHVAGIMKLVPFRNIRLAELRNMMDINFFSPVALTLSLLKARKINRGGSIVFITSINGAVVGSPANAMYSSTKGALAGMIPSMALDLAKMQIRVNNIAPAMIETEGFLEIEAAVSAEAIEEDRKKYPLGRYGKPADVANACAYLLSPASEWVTGITLTLDGGFTAQ